MSVINQDDIPKIWNRNVFGLSYIDAGGDIQEKMSLVRGVVLGSVHVSLRTVPTLIVFFTYLHRRWLCPGNNPPQSNREPNYPEYRSPRREGLPSSFKIFHKFQPEDHRICQLCGLARATLMHARKLLMMQCMSILRSWNRPNRRVKSDLALSMLRQQILSWSGQQDLTLWLRKTLAKYECACLFLPPSFTRYHFVHMNAQAFSS